MTEIEKKALALVNEVLAEWGVLKNAVEVPKNSDAFARALLRAIEQHEADKAAHAATVEGILKAHEAYKQDVSDALVDYFGEHLVAEDGGEALASFIIPKPTVDPLVRVVNEVIYSQPHGDIDEARMAADIRAALAKRGLKIVEDV